MLPSTVDKLLLKFFSNWTVLALGEVLISMCQSSRVINF